MRKNLTKLAEKSAKAKGEYQKALKTAHEIFWNEMLKSVQKAYFKAYGVTPSNFNVLDLQNAIKGDYEEKMREVMRL